MIKFRTLSRKNPQDLEAQEKFYAIPVHGNVIELEKLAKRAAAKSSLTKGDCYNVIDNFMDSIMEYLEEGQRVQLGGVGTFRISLKSEGAETPEELTSANIKRSRIVFTPGVELKRMLRDVKYKKVL
ncbi:MAG: HU family DNA-binding protein [Flavobacteriaceae bacterium]|nr:HU family DNA-binding protein [Flavobacteriaceae bacterium]